MRLIRHLYAALAMGEWAYSRAQMARVGLGIQAGAVSGTAALGAPLTD
jgi:hypothetical protein